MSAQLQKGWSAAVVLAAAALLAVACQGLLSTPIKDILGNPREFDGKDVTVKGTVKESVNVLFLKYYIVSDGTGDVAVVTEGAVPTKGQDIVVKGQVNQAFAIGDKSLIVIVEKAPSSR